MIQMKATIAYGFDDRVKVLHKAAFEAAAQAAKYWQKTYVRGHFDISAARWYGYENRSRQYMIRKAKRFHHQNPLVWSGRAKQLLTDPNRHDIVKSPNMSTATAKFRVN